MKIDPGIHIGLHLVFFGKTGVTRVLQHLSSYRTTNTSALNLDTFWYCLMYREC
jgi:hypothetical protein